MCDEKEKIITCIIALHIEYSQHYEIMQEKSVEEITEFLTKLIKVKYLTEL